MSQKEIDRKIAVIFATDVVGYSKQMEKDEDETLKSFRACKKILEKLFDEHGGRIFNTAGDSVLAEFSSAVSAVICATEFQKLIKERNESETTDLKMEFRIGINMGDVVVEGDNLYGDGVNIAARIEALAQPNGVCISRSVHEFINKKLEFLFNDLGEQTVKENKFHAFDVVIDDSQKRTLKTKSNSKIGLYVTIICLIILSIGSSFYYFEMKQNNDKQSARSSDRAVILLMPFINNSGKEDNNYIGNGMTSHLIAILSQYEQLFVLGKSTGEHIQKNKIPDEEIINLCKEIGIEIAIDLCGYTSWNKASIFYKRVAPIQINYLGYAGTMGGNFMDYIIADKILIPENHKKFFAEKIIHMPNCYQANPKSLKISNKTIKKTDFGLPEKAFIYCCFKSCKLY